MVATPYPLPRSTRRSATLAGNGGKAYGPFGDGWGVFDIEDVAVWVKRQGATRFSRVTDVTVTKTNPAAVYSTFSILLGASTAALSASDQFYVEGRRRHARAVAIARGGAMDSLQMEQELSKIAVTLQETERDLSAMRDAGLPDALNRTLRLADGDLPATLTSLPALSARAGGLLGFNAAGQPVIRLVGEISEELGNFVATLEMVNPMEPRFGAIGDGIADDTAAVQAAVAYLNARARGILLINRPHRMTAGITITSGRVHIHSPSSYQGYFACFGAFTAVRYLMVSIAASGAPIVQNLGILKGGTDTTSTALRLETTTKVGRAEDETPGGNKGPTIFGLRVDSLPAPARPVTGAVAGYPVTLTVPAHGLATGDVALVDGVEGITGINGLDFEVSVVDADTIQLMGDYDPATGSYLGGGTVERLSSGYWRDGISTYQIPHARIHECWLRGRGAKTTTKIGAGIRLGQYCNGTQIYNNNVRGFYGGIWVDDAEFFDAPLRANSTAYADGDTIRTASNTQTRFICVQPGTTAGSLPVAYATAKHGTIITDGTAVFVGDTFQAEGLAIRNHKFQANHIGVYSSITSAENTWAITDSSYDNGFANIYLTNPYRCLITGNTMGWNNRTIDHVDIYLERNDGFEEEDGLNSCLTRIENNSCFRRGNMDIDVTGISLGATTVLTYSKLAAEPAPVAGQKFYLHGVEGTVQLDDTPFIAGTVTPAGATGGTVVMLDIETGANINSAGFGAFTNSAKLVRYGRFVEVRQGKFVQVRNNDIVSRAVGVHVGVNASDVWVEDNFIPTAITRPVYNRSAVPGSVYFKPLGERENFSSRAALVQAVAAGLVGTSGHVVHAAGLAYRWQEGATAIADLPGLLPNGDVHARHFGDLVTPSTNAATLQAAIDYCEPSGLKLELPAERVFYRTTLDIQEGMTLWCKGGKAPSAAPPNLANATAALVWNAATADPMIRIKAAVSGQRVYGAEILNVVLDGSNIASHGILAESPMKCVFDVTTYRTTVAGLEINDGNSALANQNVIERHEHFCGPNVAAWSSDGLRIDGDRTGFFTTSTLVKWLEAEYVNGHGLHIRSHDSGTFPRVKSYQRIITAPITGITNANPAVVTYSGADVILNGMLVTITNVAGMPQVNNQTYVVANVDTAANTFELVGVNSTGFGVYTSGGTAAVKGIGYSVRYSKSVNFPVFHSQKNVIQHLYATGDIFIGDFCKNNVIETLISEGGSIAYESNGPNKRVFHVNHLGDFRTSEAWMTHKFKLTHRQPLPLAAAAAFGTVPSTSTFGSLGFGRLWAFSASVTNGLSWSGTLDDVLIRGKLIGARLLLQSVGSTTGDAVFRVQADVTAPGAAIGALDATITQVLTPHQGAPSFITEHFVLFETAVPVLGRGSVIAFSIERLGADVADTYVNTVGLAGVDLLMIGDGPSSAGYGPYVPPIEIDPANP